MGKQNPWNTAQGVLISCLCSGTPKGVHPLFDLIIPSWNV